MGTRKLLIAIDPGPVEKQALHCICQELRSQCKAGRKNTEDMYHVTLNIIEEAPDSKLKAIQKAMQKASKGQKPFTILTGKPGLYGTVQSATVWIGISGGQDELQLLREKLVCELAAVGIEQDKAPYQPHITLGRDVDTTVFNPPLAESLPPSVNLTAKALTLLESKNVDGRTVYEPLAVFDFS